jgi:hypothetical protein
MNNNDVLSHNATNLCLIALCGAETTEFGRQGNGTSGGNGYGGGSAFGLIAVNDSLNNNDVLSHNATNLCLVALCGAETFEGSFGGRPMLRQGAGGSDIAPMTGPVWAGLLMAGAGLAALKARLRR